jgi:hypothetical protein
VTKRLGYEEFHESLNDIHDFFGRTASPWRIEG